MTSPHPSALPSQREGEYVRADGETWGARVRTTAAQQWLTGKLQTTREVGLRAVLQESVEHLSLATAEAVTLRRTSADGQRLVPLAWYHPDPETRKAIGEIMSHTTDLADAGLWGPVVEGLRPARWHVPPGSSPAEASHEQAGWLHRFPLRAVVGAPVLSPTGVLLGGAALLRFGRDSPFSDDEQAVLVRFTERVADLVELLEVP